MSAQEIRMLRFAEMPQPSPASHGLSQECDFRNHSGRWAPLGSVMNPTKLLHWVVQAWTKPWRKE